MSYIVFKAASVPKSYVTKVWSVESKSSEFKLGQIKWFAAWRRYCFYPRPGTVWSPDCLRDVLEFCEKQTEARKLERIGTRGDR